MSDQTVEIYKKVSELTGYKPNEVAVISQQVAKGANQIELAYFLNVCRTVELNPFNKEIWCYKDGRGNLIIFTGRDGFLSNAQKRPQYNGIRSSGAYEKDAKFVIDIPNGIVLHEFDPRKDRGQLIGAYAIVFRKDGEPTVEWADLKTYKKNTPGPWQSHTEEMIKKVAEAKALKKAFGMSGVQSEHEFEIVSNVAVPVNSGKQKPELLPETEEWGKAVKALAGAYSISDLEKKYVISEENKEALQNAILQ